MDIHYIAKIINATNAIHETILVLQLHVQSQLQQLSQQLSQGSFSESLEQASYNILDMSIVIAHLQLKIPFSSSHESRIAIPHMSIYK